MLLNCDKPLTASVNLIMFEMYHNTIEHLSQDTKGTIINTQCLAQIAGVDKTDGFNYEKAFFMNNYSSCRHKQHNAIKGSSKESVQPFIVHCTIS